MASDQELAVGLHHLPQLPLEVGYLIARRAASSNCKSAAAACICVVSSCTRSARSPAGIPASLRPGSSHPWRRAKERGPAAPLADQVVGVRVSRASMSVMSAIFFRIGCGSIPLARLYATCLARRRLVSSIAAVIESVTESAYMWTSPGDVPGGPADGLDQALLTSQEPLLVGIEDGDQRHLREVQTLPEQVDADKNVESPIRSSRSNWTLQRVHLGVQVSRTDAVLEQIVGEILSHLLGGWSPGRARAARSAT